MTIWRSLSGAWPCAVAGLWRSDFRCDGPLSGRDDLRRDVNNLHTEGPLYPVALDSKSR